MRHGSIEEAPLHADHRLWPETMRLMGYDKMVFCRHNICYMEDEVRVVKVAKQCCM